EAALLRVLRRLVPGEPALEVTRVRIPTLGGSLAVVHLELSKPVTFDEITGLLRGQSGISILPREELPTPRGALGHDDVAIGRLRAAGSRASFVLALNDLRLGAALNVVAAAESLVR